MRIGLVPGKFEAAKVPEVAAAQANYNPRRPGKTRRCRCPTLRKPRCLRRCIPQRFEKARTQQETAEAQANASHQQYEAALNGARQSNQMISLPRPRSKRSHRKSRKPKKAWPIPIFAHHSTATLAPVLANRRVRGPHQQDRNHGSRQNPRAPVTDPEQRASQANIGILSSLACPPIPIVSSKAESPPSTSCRPKFPHFRLGSPLCQSR